MSTVTTVFDIGDTVYHLDDQTGIRKGIVKTIDIKEGYPTVAPTISYSVAYSKSAQGSVTCDESTLSATSADAFVKYVPMIESLY